MAHQTKPMDPERPRAGATLCADEDARELAAALAAYRERREDDADPEWPDHVETDAERVRYLTLDIDHVWTVDGEPLGIRHELQLDGDHVIARDVGIRNGRQHGPAHERRISLIQAVHVVLNATTAELESIESRFIEAEPATPVEIRRWTGSQPRKYPSLGIGPGRTSPLDCVHCGLSCGPSSDDPCIENLPGVMNACCGHGDIDEAYIQFSPTDRIGGQVAFDRMQAMRAADPTVCRGNKNFDLS